MSSAQFTGVIEGAALFGPNGSILTVPFANRLEGMKFTYNGKLDLANTFSQKGVSGASNACLVSEEAMLEVETGSITWSMLQMCMATVAESVGVAVNRRVVETFFVPVVTPAGTAAITLSNTPVVGRPISFADTFGNLITPTVAGTAVTGIPIANQGDTITAIYETAMPAGTENSVVYLGGGTRLNEATLIGRFHLCSENAAKYGALTIVFPRAVIEPSLDFNVSAGSKAKAMAKFNLLRGNIDGRSDIYAAIYKSPSFNI